MVENRISEVVPAQSVTDIDGFVTSILGKLPFLIKLDEADHHGRIMAGLLTGYVNAVNNSVNVVGTAIPQSFDVAEFNKDMDLIDKLQQIETILDTRLMEKLRDTILQVRRELLEQADHGYGLLKMAAKQGNESVKAEVDKIAANIESVSSRYPASMQTVAENGTNTVSKTVPLSRVINIGSTILDLDGGPELSGGTRQPTMRIMPKGSVVLPKGYTQIVVKNLSADTVGSFTVKVKPS
jgi:hypothetical protein